MNPVLAHCLEEAPCEAVGLVVRTAEQVLRSIPLTNVSPTPRSAFEVSPREWMAVETAVLQQGAAFHALYHSHPDAPAALSALDLARLTPGNQPLISGLEAWVISVRGGLFNGARRYRWTGQTYEAEEDQALEEIESVLFRKGCFRL